MTRCLPTIKWILNEEERVLQAVRLYQKSLKTNPNSIKAKKTLFKFFDSYKDGELMVIQAVMYSGRTSEWYNTECPFDDLMSWMKEIEYNGEKMDAKERSIEIDTIIRKGNVLYTYFETGFAIFRNKYSFCEKCSPVLMIW